jgi:TPR repeat protein
MPKSNSNKTKPKRTTKAAEDLAITLELAEEGNLSCQMELAEMYREGTKFPRNDVEALRWFLAAASQGETRAMYQVALSYFQGLGVAHDKSEAIKWLSRLAYPETTETLTGNEMLNAQILMVAIYNNPGDPYDSATAYGWLLLAICYGQPWNVEETPFNYEILNAQRETATMLEQARLKFESELTADQRAKGQKMAAELFRPHNQEDSDEEEE